MSDKIIACGLSIDEIQALADRVENGSLSRIKIKSGNGEVCIEKEVKTVLPPMPPVQTVTAPVMPVGGVSSETSAVQTGGETGETVQPVLSGNIVKAPIVGTFYSSPAPDKPPFVTVGSRVSKGDTIMIIESMKLMNEVQSEYDGIVKSILVENGAAVEFDQPIMVIE